MQFDFWIPTNELQAVIPSSDAERNDAAEEAADHGAKTICFRATLDQIIDLSMSLCS